jgi:hypothetical protein
VSSIILTSVVSTWNGSKTVSAVTFAPIRTDAAVVGHHATARIARDLDAPMEENARALSQVRR